MTDHPPIAETRPEPVNRPASSTVSLALPFFLALMLLFVLAYGGYTLWRVEQEISDALANDSGVLALTDEKGRRFIVQAAKIAYVEIGAADVRRVGFGVGVVGAEAVKSG